MWFPREDPDASDEEKYAHLMNDSHDLSADGCLSCGAAKLHDLMRPCPNTRCARCSQLNGVGSPSCVDHGAAVRELMAADAEGFVRRRSD